jgi:serine/threonine protein kinase
MTWRYKGEYITELGDMPKDVFGFIYKITNTETGEYYIGKKQIISVRKRVFGKKEIEALEDKRTKKYEMVTKESDWKSYRSSNLTVKKWFDGGELESHCKLEILRFCSNKKSLTYYELQEQFAHDVLGDRLALNDNLLGKFFRKDLE